MKIGNFTNSYSIFANIYSYMGRPLTRNPDEADVFVIGLPYDLGTSGRSGTRSGPRGIRSASSNLRWEEKRWPWDFNVFERLRVADYGDIEFPPEITMHCSLKSKPITANCSRRAKKCSASVVIIL